MIVNKRIYLHLKLIIYFVIAIFSLISCGKSQTEKRLENLSVEQRKQAEEEIKNQTIYSFVCSSFYDEVAKYKSDVKEHQLSEFYLYFPEYPSQYTRLLGIFYPSIKNTVGSILREQGLTNISPEFKDYPIPEITALPCQEKINEWIILKRQWSELNKVLPSEFYKQVSIWDHIADLLNWIEKKAVPTIFLFLIVTSISIYSIILHFALLIRKNKDGFWLILTTPLSALYWQLHFKSIYADGISYWTQILFTSLILSFVYASLAFIYEYLTRKLNDSVHNDADLSQDEFNEDLNLKLLNLIIHGDINNLISLIKSNPNHINTYNIDGLTPLLFLTKNINLIEDKPLQIALEILKIDLDVNAITKDDLGYSSLHFLASQGEDTNDLHIKLANILLSHGADPNIKNNIGWTPLHLIAINGSSQSLDLLELLIEYRVDPFALADDGKTNWRILWQHGKEIYDRLEKYERSFSAR
jgi:hypothetical protein